MTKRMITSYWKATGSVSFSYTKLCTPIKILLYENVFNISKYNPNHFQDIISSPSHTIVVIKDPKCPEQIRGSHLTRECYWALCHDEKFLRILSFVKKRLQTTP